MALCKAIKLHVARIKRSEGVIAVFNGSIGETPRTEKEGERGSYLGFEMGLNKLRSLLLKSRQSWSGRCPRVTRCEVLSKGFQFLSESCPMDSANLQPY